LQPERECLKAQIFQEQSRYLDDAEKKIGDCVPCECRDENWLQGSFRIGSGARKERKSAEKEQIVNWLPQTDEKRLRRKGTSLHEKLANEKVFEKKPAKGENGKTGSVYRE